MLSACQRAEIAVLWRRTGSAAPAPPRKRETIVRARSTTIDAQPESIDAGIAYVYDEVMPAVESMDGCIGISLLVDRESGSCIATTAWETADAMDASAQTVAPLRDRMAESFRGSATVATWEIAIVHRDHRSTEGAAVRATWFKLPHGQLDRSVGLYRESVLPALEELDGFCSASLMIDRSARRAVSSVTFDDARAMDRNREAARSLRVARLRELGAEQLDVGEFELALAHLRVPELI
jgi:quinol monooxygenase YgiN